MRLVDSPARRGFAVAVVALAIAAILGFRTLADGDGPAVHPSAVRLTASVPSATPRAVVARDVGRPERLTIPALRVDAAITAVGTDGQAQAVPASIDDTGWWRDGVQPGRAGNAVIVGHTASAADGVFDDLGKLRRGDALAVRSARGTLHYDVTRVASIKVAEFNRISPLVYRPGGAPGLVLMTCGDWNGRGYDSTTIVFSTLIAE